MKEFEKKMLLSEQEYNCFLEIFKELMSEPFEQTNYYYDTRLGTMRKQNTTVRIRKKNGCHFGTVKRHDPFNDCSTEEHFLVDNLPRMLMIGGERLFLEGWLTTKRVVVKISPDMTLMLDKNTYMGATDYELELEYGEGIKREAEGVMILLLRMINKTMPYERSMSKSDRFFSCIHSGESTNEV